MLYNHQIKDRKANNIISLVCLVFLCLTINGINAQIPDPNQGHRADWILGSWGVNWKPENFANGSIEGVSIKPYLDGLSSLRTLDYVQIHLTESNIQSPSHSAPHQLLESLWQNDRNPDDTPFNLVVPREAADDPFLRWLKQIKAAGLKTVVYVNSYNLLARDVTNIPNDYPDFSNRWMDWCNTNEAAQAFINSQPYHTDGINDRRPYMFCYAEFILKEYAMRYGDLIDAWSFDAADNIMEDECGDDPASGEVVSQRLYQAFADACHSGNPNAAISFNNSVGTAQNPYTTPTLFDDFTFGHPFGGAGNMVETQSLYDRNFYMCEVLESTNGLPFDTTDNIAWNDNVVGRFFPKWSTTSWNAGTTPCLTDEQFVEWTNTATINGGSITWGTALIRNNLSNAPELIIQPSALHQYDLADAYLKEFQSPGAPNWSRQYTILPPAYTNIPYSHSITEGIDVWDPEGDDIISLEVSGGFPSWLTIEESEPGIWILSGTPIEAVDTTYNFELSANDASGDTSRSIELVVFEEFIPEPIVMDVEIQALENTTYSSGAVTMSGSGSVPGYDTTFEVTITVEPNGDFTTYPNAVIVSGTSDNSGNSTAKSWGISSDGSNEATNDRIFDGEEQWSATISNATIENIVSSSGISSENLEINTFKSITIVNAHSVGDRFTFSADGSIDFGLGRFNSEARKIVNLNLAAVNNNIESFTIKNGSSASNDKWAVDGITVQISLVNFPSTLGINNFDESLDSVAIFPNPTKNKFTISLDSDYVEIFNLQGKLVQKKITNTRAVDISELSKGIYIIKIHTKEANIYTKKLIKI
ncbi:T9SS type A sorting domain-containing protein [Winogradskyella psychrotolerans]|uniref:T9SS type A sorting domain-containing protein n=1 Tax=Winogradskyella psychrotolerans TaxID=1344585 RepID=UPI001C065D0E|nr:T9SS type A sorting domain-containing protein [Winogradskyella psychrotolerans]MBU2929868.1 T9SS type A sorting domain-containing protein [Winogradskyella psychrotolerans]